jgi:hypothetical protein
MNKKLEQTIEDAAEILAEFSKDLANKWRNEPFARVAIAQSFAAGFTKSETEDPPAVALAVFHVATLDKKFRALQS